MTPVIDNFLARLDGVKKSGQGWQALCAAHEDIKPSLSINEGDDGRVLLYCHAGCDFGSIVQSLGMSAQNLMPENGHSASESFSKMKIKETYDYRDELAEATECLAIRGMHVSIYNLQLCLLDRSVWQYTRKAISDWKNIYIQECLTCSVKEQCGGLFAWDPERHSKHIAAIA